MNKAARLSALLAFGLFWAYGALAASSGAPGPATVWDRIMQEQSLMNLRKGYLLMEAEKYPEAANEFLKAIARTPSEPYARILYGSSLYWLGEPDKAMAEFNTAEKLDPGNAVAFQLMGIVHAWKGEIRQALEKFLRARDLARDRADVRMNIGSIYHSLGDMDKALEYFREAVRLEPANPLYLYQLGLLYSRLGRVSDAKTAFRRALSSFRDYEDAMLELAVMEEKDGNDKEAARLYHKALDIKPGDNVARFRLGCLLYRTGDIKRLNGLLEDAFLLTPSNAKGGISISLAYAGDPDPRPGGGKPGSLENAVSKIPADEDVNVKAEFVSIPETRLVVQSEGKPKTLKAGLEQNFKRPQVTVFRREYSLPASDFKNRGARAAQIAAEMDKAIKAAAREGQDTRMSINIETKKASLSAAGGDPGVVYKPRDVGNDMGLWVMGAGWLENVADALEDLRETPGGAAQDPRLSLLRGLGSLIMGEPDAALAAMEGVQAGATGDLGRCAAWVEKGSQENAIAACTDALRKEPKNKIALANKKWLTRDLKLKI
ncbi:MAG: tetratricopeptide repeat protein [Elusimicrobiota bacterium]